MIDVKENETRTLAPPEQDILMSAVLHPHHSSAGQSAGTQMRRPGAGVQHAVKMVYKVPVSPVGLPGFKS